MNTLETSPFKGIIFDLDGTLADTKLDFAQMCIDSGLPVGTRILEHCDSLDEPQQIDAILRIVEKHEMEGANQASWIADAPEVLSLLNKASIPMAIVTRNMRKAAQLTIDKLSIPIEFLITREDCLPKPHPDGLLMVANQWKIPPSQLVYVGDFKFDMIAAKQAGMNACLLANDRNAPFHHMADKVIQSFRELLSYYDLKDD